MSGSEQPPPQLGAAGGPLGRGVSGAEQPPPPPGPAGGPLGQAGAVHLAAVRPVTSARDRRVARAARLLRDPAACRAEGTVALDGDEVLAEALEAGLEPELVIEDAARAAEPAPWRALLRGRAPTAPAGPDALRALAALGQPPRVVGLLRLAPAPRAEPLPPGAVVLCELGDAGNVGSIVRTATALGVPRVVPCGEGADPLGRRALRASLGTTVRPGLVSEPAPSLAALAASADRPPLAAAVPRGGVAPEELAPGAVIVLGRERTGLTPEELAACDLAVTIPAPGFESLNVAAAAAILLYATTRRAARTDG